MPDNTTLNPGAGGDVIATDDIGGVKHELVKVEFGVDGAATMVSASDPLPVTQSGVATSAKQDTIIGHLDGVEALLTTIDADTSTLAGAVAGAEMQVDVVTSALPTGAATSAKQDTVIGHLDGVETLLGTIDADTSALAGTVSGTEVRVAIISGAGSGGTAMVDDAAFTAAVTSFTPVGGIVTADSIDSGDGGAFAMLANRQQKVTLYDSSGNELSVGGGTQYTEDAAAAANPVGTALNLVRDDARGGSLTTTDGDNVAARGTNAGELYVKHVDSVAVTNAGLTELAAAINGSSQMDVNIAANGIGLATSAKQDTMITSLGLLDDAIFAEDVAAQAADKGIAILAVRRDADTSLVGADNDYANLQVNANGALKVEVFSGETLPVSLASVPSHAVTNAGTFAVQVDGAALTALQLIDDPVATLGTTTYTETTTKGMLAGAVRRDADTSAVNTDNEAAPLLVDARGALKVEAFSGETLPVSLASVPSHAVTNAGTFAVQVDGSALTALQKIDDPVLVDDAAFTPATSSVMMAGFEADETSTDSVDEGDAGAARMTLDRKVIVNSQPHTSGGLSTFMASGSDGSSILVATAQAVKASAGQLYGYYLYNPEAAVTFVHFYNTAAASVTVGTTNPLFTLPVPAGSAANLMGANGIEFTNAGWSIAATTTAGGNTAPATGVSAVVWFK